MAHLILHLVLSHYSSRHSEILYSWQSINLIGSRLIRTVHNESQHHGIVTLRNPRAGNLY